ncbi:MAG: GTPase Era [Calditrichaeota bacterium]|nr:MAG: GTPase Era [Calditrichota bacterium]
MTTPFKCGYAAIIGLPNAGKSTLMNNLLDIHLGIVSARPQTTRRNALGIMNREDMQCIFLDTPGIVKPKYELHDRMNKQIEAALKDADVVVLMVDAHSREHPVDLGWPLQFLKKHPVIVVLNKIDLMDKRRLLPLTDLYEKELAPAAIIPVSAEKRDGLEVLTNELHKWLPEGPPLYPPDSLTDQPERFFVGEIIREQIFHSYHDEIPYSADVVIDTFKERENVKDYIRAIIFVERESQKGILIGKGGVKLKKTGQRARQAVEYFLQRPVYLELKVKVQHNWRKDKNALNRFGYG